MRAGSVQAYPGRHENWLKFFVPKFHQMSLCTPANNCDFDLHVPHLYYLILLY